MLSLCRRLSVWAETSRHCDRILTADQQWQIESSCQTKDDKDGIVSERRAIDKRIAAGDGWAIHDAIVNGLNELSFIADRVEAVLVEDSEALTRLRDLALAKPLYGIEPVIAGGRQAGDIVSQETALTDQCGKER